MRSSDHFSLLLRKKLDYENKIQNIRCDAVHFTNVKSVLSKEDVKSSKIFLNTFRLFKSSLSKKLWKTSYRWSFKLSTFFFPLLLIIRLRTISINMIKYINWITIINAIIIQLATNKNAYKSFMWLMQFCTHNRDTTHISFIHKDILQSMNENDDKLVYFYEE